MKILADFHHPDLYESYLLTLQDRLGYDVYRMIGLEWYDAGLWSFEKAWAGDTFAQRSLSLRETDTLVGDHYERVDERHPGRVFKMLTLEQAIAMTDINYILTSVTDNHHSFRPFVKANKKLKHIIQMGNNEHHVNWDHHMVALVGTEAEIPKFVSYVRYSPEFDTENLFKFTPVPVDGPISSFLLVWHLQRTETLGMFNYVRENVDREFKMFGEEGVPLDTEPLMAKNMQEAAAFWHTKPVGDGYGFVIHQAAAIGRPIIGNRKYYLNCRAKFLWDPDSTLDIDSMKPETVAKAVEGLLADPERMIRMGERANEVFRAHVNFDEDAENIKKLLERHAR